MIAKRINSLKKRGLRNRRSKLEMYTAILKVLANRGPLITTHIMQKVNINSKMLKEYVEFLIKQGLVEERIAKGRRIGFEITPRGVSVLKGFKAVEKVFLPLDAKLAHE